MRVFPSWCARAPTDNQKWASPIGSRWRWVNKKDKLQKYIHHFINCANISTQSNVFIVSPYEAQFISWYIPIWSDSKYSKHVFYANFWHFRLCDQQCHCRDDEDIVSGLYLLMWLAGKVIWLVFINYLRIAPPMIVEQSQGDCSTITLKCNWFSASCAASKIVQWGGHLAYSCTISVAWVRTLQTSTKSE